MRIDFDVDIDMADRDKLLSLIPHVPASIIKDGKYTKHNTGVYIQNIPYDPLENISKIEHKQAEQEGWFKVDVLNNSVYADIKDETHLNNLINTEPFWDLLLHKEVVEQLFHINNHYDIVSQYKPQSIEQLAMILAMIRPGKRYLVGKPWDIVEKDIWIKPDNNTYFFKKSHAVAYALTIVVQLNFICEQLSRSS